MGASEFPFCEARWHGYPEFASSISAAVILLLGILGSVLVAVHCRNAPVVLLLFSLMTVNGAASFAAHFSGNPNWIRMDEFTISIAAVVIVPLLIHEAIHHPADDPAL
ncbi:hypothetical protein DFJ73DRAFT_865540, partial [Zopfochytrium polystomum]